MSAVPMLFSSIEHTSKTINMFAGLLVLILASSPNHVRSLSNREKHLLFNVKARYGSP
jgi:hypothetical protein